MHFPPSGQGQPPPPRPDARFEPQQATPIPAGSRRASTPRAPRLLAGPAIVIQALSALLILVVAWDFVLRLQDRGLINRFDAGELPTVEEVDNLDNNLRIAWALRLGLGLLSVLVLIFWVYRAYSNLHNSYRGTIHRRGWAIGSWFVPFLNLWRPFKIVQEIWRNSPEPAGTKSDGIVSAWWTLWIVGWFIGRLGAQDVDSISGARQLNTTLLVSDAVDLIGILLLIVLVRSITTTQDVRSTKIGWAAPTPPPRPSRLPRVPQSSASPAPFTPPQYGQTLPGIGSQTTPPQAPLPQTPSPAVPPAPHQPPPPPPAGSQ